jgi:hypothetical protein
MLRKINALVEVHRLRRLERADQHIDVNEMKMANLHVGVLNLFLFTLLCLQMLGSQVEREIKNYQLLTASMSTKLRLLHVCDVHDGCIVSQEQFRFLDEKSNNNFYGAASSRHVGAVLNAQGLKNFIFCQFTII